MEMSDEALIKKLGIKPGQRLLVLNAPDGYLERLRPLPEGATLAMLATVDEGEYDFVHAFARNVEELRAHAPVALRASKREGGLWFSYPKRSARVATDLSRDVGWDLLDAAGYQGVAQVSIDEVWSAVRFRPRELVRGGDWRRRPGDGV
jgi:hypothetical protein